MKKNHNRLESFYQDRFSSNPDRLLEAANSKISTILEEYDIDWAATQKSVFTGGDKVSGRKIKFIQGRNSDFKGAVAIFCNEKSTPWGAKIPHLVANNLRNEGPRYLDFDGFEYLRNLYRQEKNLPVDTKEQQKRAEERKAIEAQREKEAAENKAKAALERAIVIKKHECYQQAFMERDPTKTLSWDGKENVTYLKPEDGSNAYLKLKKITDIVPYADLHLMSERLISSEQGRPYSRSFLAIEMKDVAGNYRGLQRLYGKKKRFTESVRDGQFDGAHAVIGDLRTTTFAYVAEGFATAASIFLATQTPVICAFNADNVKKVVADYQAFIPQLKLKNVADNDQWKPHAGNKGLRTALEVHKDYKVSAAFPTFNHLTLAEGSRPTDFNDLHVLDGLKAVKKQLKSKDNKLISPNKEYHYLLKKIAYSGYSNGMIQHDIVTALRAGLKHVPIRVSSRDIYEDVMSFVPEDCLPHIDKSLVLKKLRWMVKAKLHQAKKLKGFTRETLAQEHVIYRKLEGKTVVLDDGTKAHEVPPELLETIKNLPGIIIIKAPMGYGKTKLLIKPIMQNSEKAGYIAHRVSLVEDASNRLDITNYQQVNGWLMPYTKKLACCVNSISKNIFTDIEGKSWFESVDTLCIDEVSQVIRHMTHGPVSNPVKVMDCLLSAMKTATRVVMCDADANDDVIDFCTTSFPDEKIHVFEVTGSCKHIEVQHNDVNTILGHAVNAALKGKKCLIADDGADDGKKIVELINANNPDLNVLHVHGNNKAEENVERFLANPNKECVNYDVVIYSPAISSGVSIETPHFDRHFGIFYGVVTPSDAIQMMRRDRTARHFELGLGHLNTRRDTNKESLYRSLVAADQWTTIEDDGEEIVFRRKKTLFDTIYLNTTATENKARNDFANNLLLMLIADGYQVSAQDKDDRLRMVVAQEKKAIKELIFNKDMKLIQAQETPDEDLAITLKLAESKSQEEAAALKRYNLVNELCVSDEEINDDLQGRQHIQFYAESGLKPVKRMELLLATEKQASDYDKAQLKSKVVLTRHRFTRATRHVLTTLMNTLSIDLHTGQGEFTHVECREAMIKILHSEEAIALYNALKIGPHVYPQSLPKCPTTWVKSILKRLALEIDKRKTNGNNKLSINPCTWEAVMFYVTRRKAAGVSCLDFTEHDESSAYQPLPVNDPIIKDDGKEESVKNRDTLKKDHITTANYPSKTDQSLISNYAVEVVCIFAGWLKVKKEIILDKLTKVDLEKINKNQLKPADIWPLLSAKIVAA